MAENIEDIVPNFIAALSGLAKQSAKASSGESALATILSGITSGPTISDRWFSGTTVYLDGYTFERCRFDSCNLVTERATFSFRDCFISPNCDLYFKGPALKVVQLILHSLGLKGRVSQTLSDVLLGLFPTVNNDGTFSIS